MASVTLPVATLGLSVPAGSPGAEEEGLSYPHMCPLALPFLILHGLCVTCTVLLFLFPAPDMISLAFLSAFGAIKTS